VLVRRQFVDSVCRLVCLVYRRSHDSTASSGLINMNDNVRNNKKSNVSIT
jgi:hypothetical protein